jgi:hypothetical protein
MIPPCTAVDIYYPEAFGSWKWRWLRKLLSFDGWNPDIESLNSVAPGLYGTLELCHVEDSPAVSTSQGIEEHIFVAMFTVCRGRWFLSF